MFKVFYKNWEMSFEIHKCLQEITKLAELKAKNI